jgi:hypothetical protein
VVRFLHWYDFVKKELRLLINRNDTVKRKTEFSLIYHLNFFRFIYRTTWTAVRAPFSLYCLYWPVDVDFASKKETCTYLKCNLLIAVQMMNNDIFLLSTKCKQKWHRNALIWQRFATSRFGSNENIFPVCQSFEAFSWLTVSASKLNLSQIINEKRLSIDMPLRPVTMLVTFSMKKQVYQCTTIFLLEFRCLYIENCWKTETDKCVILYLVYF